MEELQSENAQLELEVLKGQYRQLLTEGPEEEYGERRFNLLKAQLMQLERQVVLLSEGLSSQVCRCLDVEKALDPLTHTLRSLLCSDSSSAEVTITRSDLTRLIEMCSNVTQTLHRNNKVNTVEGLSVPWVLAPPSLLKQPVSLLDLCYCRMDSINLQYVSSVECGLSQLFRHLQGLKHTLTHILGPSNHPGYHPSNNPCPETAPRVMYECLMSLSSRYVQREQQNVCMEFEVKDILSLLPSMSRGAQQRATRAAQALTHTHTHNHALCMARLQLEAGEAELQFQRRLSSLQANQSQQLHQGLRHAYSQFQNEIQQSVCDPLRDILSGYDALVISASEAALGDLLSAFERNQSELREALQALTPSQEEGEEALAQCGRDFLLAADRLRKEWEEQRDRAAADLCDIQVALASAQTSLGTLRRERSHTHISDTHTPDTHTPDTHILALTQYERSDAVSKSPLSTLANHSLPHRALSNQNTPHRALSNESAGLSDVTSGVSELFVSQQHRVSQRQANQRAERSSKGLSRPPWQS